MQHLSPEGMVGAVSPCSAHGQAGGHGRRHGEGAHLAILAAVAVGTLGPCLQRAVVCIAAWVGALLRGEKTTPP